MTATFRDRIAQAIGDPGSITGNRFGPSWGEGNEGYAAEQESVTRWQTRAVLEVVSEHRWAPDAEPAGGGGSGTAWLIAAYGALLFGVGLWLGWVWL
jgi:hypothetical protein